MFEAGPEVSSGQTMAACCATFASGEGEDGEFDNHRPDGACLSREGKSDWEPAVCGVPVLDWDTCYLLGYCQVQGVWGTDLFGETASGPYGGDQAHEMVAGGVWASQELRDLLQGEGSEEMGRAVV